MLIVIVIIGILAAALVPRLQSVQWRARDTRRKTDMLTIQKWLEIYRLDAWDYPQASSAASGTCAYNTNCARYSVHGSPWLNTLTGILTTIPIDPINNADQPWVTGNYSYAYGNVYTTSTDYFDMFGQLESPTDPDRCALKDYYYYKLNWSAGIQYCGSLTPQGYVITAY